MKNIQTTSILIRDRKGSILFLIERNKVEFNEKVKIVSDEYYQIGSPIYINEKKYKITDLQFVYRDSMADFQTIITIE